MVDDRTVGQKTADIAAKWIGAWAFIITSNFVISVWIALNAYYGAKAFDAFPFILLNLGLSWTAAIQAPLIMISQNRQEEIQKETLLAILRISQATRALMEEHSITLDALGKEIIKNE